MGSGLVFGLFQGNTSEAEIKKQEAYWQAVRIKTMRQKRSQDREEEEVNCD
jgi:hypothetical protein